ncbi:MAG TPA: hypothetical protein VNV43_08620, partial [Candidatus Acidoferrales bacterium]|nr:hypothetical protein [Candidatus Acidoferrales bacterium]
VGTALFASGAATAVTARVAGGTCAVDRPRFIGKKAGMMSNSLPPWREALPKRFLEKLPVL